MHKIEVQFSQNLARFAVSLFTGEWIEIFDSYSHKISDHVSLFTGEWIEISLRHKPQAAGLSPSLRGSGLKWRLRGLTARTRHVSLFTGEWIEIFLLWA